MNILVIDTGTSSMRAVLFSPNGRRVFTARQAYEPLSENGGLKVEQDPQDFVRALEKCCRDVVCQGFSADAMALTAQRSSVIAVDGRCRALHPAIMWHDKRSAGICARANAAYGDTLARIGGMHALPAHSAPKMAYLKSQIPGIYAKAEKLVGIQDYLLYYLTGRFVTDTSLASRSMLMDVETGKWSPELLDIFGLDAGKLCELLPTGSVCGSLSDAAACRLGLRAGIPVVTAGGDQQSAVLGFGAASPGCTVINIGTGSYSAAVADRFVPSGTSGISVLRSAQEGKWIFEASAPSAGDAVKWFCSVFYDSPAAFARFSADAEASAPGAGGVLSSCSINGTGTPDWNSSARAFFSGLSASSGRRDMARAMMEAIAADAADNARRVMAMSGRTGRVFAAGGITESGIFRRILCDTLGMDIRFPADAEATSRGAWMTAAAALGLYPSPEAAGDTAGVYDGGTVYRPDAASHDIYTETGAQRSRAFGLINGGNTK